MSERQWPVKPLEDVVEILDKFRVPVNSKERESRKGNIPYYGATGQTGWIDDYIFDEELVLLGEDGAPFLDHSKPSAYIIRGKAWVNNHAHVLRSKPGLNNRFLLHYLNQLNYTPYISGTTRAKLPQGPMKQIPIPIPPINYQLSLVEAIDTQLSRLDETVATLEAILSKLKQARASILKAAVEGRLVETEAELAQRQSSYFESGDQLLLRSLGEREVQHNAESSKEKRSRRYKAPASPDPRSVDDLMPPGWALGSIDQISSGLRYSLCIGPFGSNLKVIDYCEEGVPLIFVRNIRAENFSIEQATFVTLEKAAELSAHMARPGDILITKMGDPPGDSAIYPEGSPEAVITADVIKLHVASTYSLRFILYALRSPFFRRQILSQTKGVAQKKVSLERFAKIPIPIPPFAEQERIADEVERRFSVLDQVESTVQASLARCGLLRQAILKRAFEGRLVPAPPKPTAPPTMPERSP